MTPISFALEILLDCTTIEQAHKKARKHIKELEKSTPTNSAPPRTLAQSPSTQRLLDAQIQTLPPIGAPVLPPRIAGGELDNGDGTKGKRKW